MLAAIPYTTFPEIDLGPVSLRSFGILVAIGVVLGVILGSRQAERIGVTTDECVSLATRLVVSGVVGARLTWVLTHLSDIDSPLDVIAVWEGGLQFSGGFITATIVGMPVFRRWSRLTRWRMFDIALNGLVLGVCIGRIGCYAVGEHLGGSPTSFFLASRYESGPTREPVPPPELGVAIHNTSFYEFLHLGVLSAVMWWIISRRRATPGTAMGVFCLWYAFLRFGTDFLRGFDDTVLGLTGAQWMCLLLLLPLGLFTLLRARPSNARLLATEEAGADAHATEQETGAAPDDRSASASEDEPDGPPSEARLGPSGQE